jgi:hypothetical protein
MRRSVFTMPRAIDHSAVTTLRLLAIHLLLYRGLRFSVVFFGCRCCLVFVFVVILLLYFCYNFCIFIFILLSVFLFLFCLVFVCNFVVLPALNSSRNFFVIYIALCDLGRPGLLMVLFELLVNTIASCSVMLDRIQYLFLHLHCFLSFGLYCWGTLSLCFGFIVGEFIIIFTFPPKKN